MKQTKTSFNSPMLLKRATLCLMCFALLTGCTQFIAKRIYYNLDWLIIAKVDDYVDLNSAQEDFLEAELPIVLKRHQQQELKPIIDLMKNFNNQFTSNMTPEQTDALFDDFMTIRKRHVVLFQDVIAQFMITIEPKQLEEMQEAFAEYNEEKAEQLEDSEYREKYQEKWIGFFEDTLGQLSITQKRLIREASEGSLNFWQYRNDQRQLNQQRFITFLQNNPTYDEVIAGPIEWLKDGDVVYTDAYRAAYRTRIASVKQFYVALSQSLSKPQKVRFNREMNYYISLVESLQS